MRGKLFLAFFVIVLTALVSNLIFARFVFKDFDEYLGGIREDHVYWVISSVEGSFKDGKWQKSALSDSLHWAMMLGLDAEVRDLDDNIITNSRQVFDELSPSMKRRMHTMSHPNEPKGQFDEYPLFANGEEVGILYVRDVGQEDLRSKKDAIFKKRSGRDFLIISFAIAGSVALMLSVFFSILLARPVRRLKQASEEVAEGNLSVRVKTGAKDEIGVLSETFNRMVETLEKDELLRKHLSSNIAHELRTPLTIMKGNVEAMLDGVLPNDREGLENIRIEVERLIGLVEGIEDFTKAEASFFKKAEYEEINLRDFLMGVSASMRPLFVGKGLYINVVEGDEFIVKTDPSKLEKALRNVLSNALRHTTEGGAAISYFAESGSFVVVVKDTGEGIDEAELPKVFERFYKGLGSDGRGLGLAIVKELVEVMSGRVEIESQKGRGTTLTIRLPIFA